MWEQVQIKRGKVRNKRTTTGEHNMFSGLLECSTCGSNLNFHFNQGNHEITYFNCPNYNNRGRTCDATHYIRTDFLEEIIKNDIARITAFTEHYENEFIKLLTDSSVKETEKKTQLMEKELETLSARSSELDVLFERIYEDSVIGKITEERFAKMSKKYENEQSDIQTKIALLQKEIRIRAKKKGTANEFLEIVRNYTDMKELTPQILREFVEKIIIHHREKIDGVEIQKVEIIYNCVGTIEIPNLKKIPQKEITMKTRKGVALHYSNPQKAS